MHLMRYSFQIHTSIVTDAAYGVVGNVLPECKVSTTGRDNATHKVCGMSSDVRRLKLNAVCHE